MIHNELDGTLTGSATSVSVIKDESIENKCLSMWMVYANEAGEESLFGCCVAAAERLIPHRVKTQRLRAEFEADIVLRVMKYSAGEAAKTGWRQGGGGQNGGTGVLRAAGGASEGAEMRRAR